MKRGRKPKNPSLLESVNPKVMREILGLVIAVLALVLILAEFNAAGYLGATIFGWFKLILGVVAYFFSFWIAFCAVMLIEPNFIRRSRIIFWGLLVFLIFFSGLISSFGADGGIFGNSIAVSLRNSIGQIATFIIMFIGCLVSLLVVFNISLAELLKKANVQMPGRKSYSDFSGVKTGRVSVFKAVRRHIGMDREKPAAPQPQIADGTWKFPSIELLQESTGKAEPGNIAKNVEVIIKTLADFGVEVSPGKINVGPTVTQYELKPAEGVKLTTIKARQDDLALALAMHPVRVEAPIPGKSAVGVEVPNKQPAIVSLRELIDSETFRKRKSNLSLPLGIDVSGEIILADLKKMPHLLVAGATGSGKSVSLNSMLLSLVYQNSPRDLRILLVDPKRVEFTHYNGIPHLLTPVVSEVDKTVNLLRWTIAEMERRFRLFEQVGSRNIESYNEKFSKGGTAENGTYHEKIPYIALVIDELADLMAQASNEVEAAIVRLAQLARATGIHLIVATQRPSVDVITGLIKANITSRIAFSVASQVDSRTILDQGGAEKLLSNGDMLFLGGEFNKPKRIQGAFVSEKDVKNVTDFLKSEGSAIYDNSVTEYHEIPGLKGKKGFSSLDGGDELLPEAKQLVVQSGVASASFLQRRLKIGYARAARLLDLMEEEGIIGPAQGAKPRDILVDSIDEVGGENQGPSDSSPDIGFKSRNF